MKSLVKIILMLLLLLAILCLCTPIVIRTMYPLKYADAIEEYSQKYNLDKYLVMGIISAESRFDEDAISHKNAKGLMQLKDETAHWCAQKFDIDGQIYEPTVNIEIGCAYLKYLTDEFGENKEIVLAAYNAGPGNVKTWLGDEKYSDDGKTLKKIPYRETSEYVGRVERRANIYKKIYDKKS